MQAALISAGRCSGVGASSLSIVPYRFLQSPKGRTLHSFDDFRMKIIHRLTWLLSTLDRAIYPRDQTVPLFSDNTSLQATVAPFASLSGNQRRARANLVLT